MHKRLVMGIPITITVQYTTRDGGKYCGVVPILFGWFLRVPSLHVLVFIQKTFCDLYNNGPLQRYLAPFPGLEAGGGEGLGMRLEIPVCLACLVCVFVCENVVQFLLLQIANGSSIVFSDASGEGMRSRLVWFGDSCSRGLTQSYVVHLVFLLLQL